MYIEHADDTSTPICVADCIIVEIRLCFEILMHSTLQVAITQSQHIIFSVLHAIPSSVQPLTLLGTPEVMQNNFSTTARQLSAFEIVISTKKCTRKFRG